MTRLTPYSLISASLDGELARIGSTLEHSVGIGERGDIERWLCDRLEISTGTEAHSLDLIGHSTNDDQLLRLGDWVIDASKHSVTGFFRELADHDVFGRLGIQSLRLLGCETAGSARGRATIRVLADILGIDVLGATGALVADHYDARGFRDDAVHALVSARDLVGATPIPMLHGTPVPRALDIDALPASPLRKRSWRSSIADRDSARAILKLIRRAEGAYMPSLDPVPRAEVCLPSMNRPGWYCVLELVADAGFVRVRMDEHGPGVVFPVADPVALRELVRDLPCL